MQKAFFSNPVCIHTTHHHLVSLGTTSWGGSACLPEVACRELSSLANAQHQFVQMQTNAQQCTFASSDVADTTLVVLYDSSEFAATSTHSNLLRCSSLLPTGNVVTILRWVTRKFDAIITPDGNSDGCHLVHVKAFNQDQRDKYYRCSALL